VKEGKEERFIATVVGSGDKVERRGRVLEVAIRSEVIDNADLAVAGGSSERVERIEGGNEES